MTSPTTPAASAVSAVSATSAASAVSATRIAFIGGGNMARSLIGGLLNAGWCGGNLSVAEPAAAAREELKQRFGGRGVTCVDDNAAAVEAAAPAAHADAVAEPAPGAKFAAAAPVAGIVVLAVKPQSLRVAVQSAAAQLQRHRPLLISIAAGVRCADILRWAGAEFAIVRAMPNTPALVNAGISGLFANRLVSGKQRALAESVLRAVGETLWVDDEALIDTVTGISGSGPAYLFKWMELLAAGAQAHGLDCDAARRLVAQTALGAALLAKHNGLAPAELRRQVTSSGGVTEAALQQMDALGLDAAVLQGIDAAVRRSAQMADEFAGELVGESGRESGEQFAGASGRDKPGGRA